MKRWLLLVLLLVAGCGDEFIGPSVSGIGRVLFTDPVVITGLVTNEELATRSSIGFFLFAPPGVNEHLIGEAGLALVRLEDGTENAARISTRWHDARAQDRDALVAISGPAARAAASTGVENDPRHTRDDAPARRTAATTAGPSSGRSPFISMMRLACGYRTRISSSVGKPACAPFHGNSRSMPKRGAALTAASSTEV